ncbi:MAG: response regulator transcription factor [Bacteroidota bacterium]
MSFRVLLADDHPLWRAGVRRLLEAEPDLEVVGEAGTGPEAVAKARSLRPDVVVLDMEMPGLNGVEVARHIKAEQASVQILALSAYDEPAFTTELLKVGATGYITKEQAPEMIAATVRAIAQGEERWFVRVQVSPFHLHLSKREQEVLIRMAQGHTNEEIAKALSIREGTVRNHITSLYAKLEVKSSREAVAWAWKQGLVVPRSPGA